MKVVILDDEEKVCRLVHQLVDWDELGMRVVGTAGNGIDGLALIERERPDLVITDIRMPGLDGLELIGRIKEKVEGIEFIIISGYHQFEYAHTAIRYGVEDYLLKPIKQAELTATLRKIAERRRRRVQDEQAARELEEQFERTRGTLRREFFSEVVFAKVPVPELPLESVNRRYGYRFAAGLFQIVLIKIDCTPEKFSEGMVRMLAEQAEAAIRRQLEAVCTELELLCGPCRIHVLLNYPEPERQRVRRLIKLVSDELKVRRSIFEAVELTIGLGAPVERPEQAAESLLAAACAVDRRLFGSTGFLYEENRGARQGPYDYALAEWNRGMERACELPDPCAAASAVEALDRAVRTLPSCTGGLLLETVREAAHRLFILLRNRREEGFEDAAAHERAFSDELDLLSSADAVIGRLHKLVETVFERIAESRRQTESRPIREARRYIAEHYRESGISLEQVAEAVGFNPSYFSQLFKRETGSGFLEYLTEIRIERAKELLRTTNDTIASIASEVGYSDTKYFTHLFRRIAGVKPSEFRKLYG